MHSKNIFLSLFTVDALLSIGWAASSSDHLFLFNASKYLLMPLLAGYAWCAAPRSTPYKPWLFWGLLFYWGGDTLLTLVVKNELFFTLGLASFLVGHLFFIFCFLKLRCQRKNQLHSLWMALPLAYVAWFMAYLNGHLGAMMPFVLVYALTLACVLMAAMLRYQQTDHGSFLCGLLGVVLFVSSDSMIGINKFHHPLPYAQFFIMVTYISAVFLMVKGCLMHQASSLEVGAESVGVRMT